jgi:hypothetical protein
MRLRCGRVAVVKRVSAGGRASPSPSPPHTHTWRMVCGAVQVLELVKVEGRARGCQHQSQPVCERDGWGRGMYGRVAGLRGLDVV